MSPIPPTPAPAPAPAPATAAAAQGAAAAGQPVQPVQRARPVRQQPPLREVLDGLHLRELEGETVFDQLFGPDART